MQKRLWVVCVCIFGMAWGCKSSSLGSSELLHQTEVFERPADENCFVWKFHLVTTLNMIVFQNEIRESAKRHHQNPEKYSDADGNPIRRTVEEILPKETAKQMIDTIIKTEGYCSRELLYDGICRFNTQSGFTSLASIIGDIDMEYVSYVMGVPISASKVKQLGVFLQKHAANASKIESFFPKFGVTCDSCPGKISYQYYNSFGFCMLRKYEAYFAERDVFDFAPHYRYSEGEWETLDMPRFREFIRFSQELSDRHAQQNSEGSSGE